MKEKKSGDKGKWKEKMKWIGSRRKILNLYICDLINKMTVVFYAVEPFTLSARGSSVIEVEQGSSFSIEIECQTVDGEITQGMIVGSRQWTFPKIPFIERESRLYLPKPRFQCNFD